MPERPKAESGIVLMLVIWVIAILMVIVLSLSMTVRSQTLSTLAFRNRAEEKFLAEAGIQRAIMELQFMNKNGIANGVINSAGDASWRADGTACEGRLADGSYTVSILGETGKLDINMVPVPFLKNLLMQLGQTDEDAESMAACIMDWKNPTGLASLKGAGSEYYMSLPNPYEPKGANFEVMEELLLVKGMTPELLYGSSNGNGLIDYLTVNSKSVAVNVNYAPKEVLLSIPGMNEQMADQIIGYRETKKIAGAQELQALLGPNYGPLSPYLTTADANVFTIESIGHKDGRGQGYPIRATVMMDFTNNSYKYLYYKSPAYRG
ncbi:MAG: type II secretion system protein GspK [Nitrospiraceae bacterium]|nr:type II secretion system protein GspK [Nitrospiraceae bacterium]